MIAPQQLGSFETLLVPESSSRAERRVALQNWVAGAESDTATKIIDFHDAWKVQKDLLDGHLDRLLQQQQQQPEDDGSSSSSFWTDQDFSTTSTTTVAAAAPPGKDTVIFLEHAPVYTLGTGSDEKFVKQQQQQDAATAIPVVRMDRGGEVTYHGPGQLTVYPVLDLRHYKQDIHWYVRALEEVVLLALQECGLDQAVREDGVTGVWVEGAKVAAVGVKCKRWITQHGFAINVTPEALGNFDGIVPCGLEGRRVGCVNQFLPVDQAITVRDMATYVQSAMEEVFQMELREMTTNSGGSKYTR